MESYAHSLSTKLPDCVNATEFLAYNLNPVVVLTDFRKSLNKVTTPETCPPTPCPPTPPSQDAQSPACLPSFSPDAPAPAPITLTPPSSISSCSLSTSGLVKSGKRRRRSCDDSDLSDPSDSSDPSAEYEIERIVGYHRDKRCKMWYFVKWKNWSSEYNTFEPIDHLTGCNLELMRYFEMEPPSADDMQKKHAEVKEGLRKRDIYKRLVGKGYKAEELEEFSRGCLDLSELFQAAGSLKELEAHMRTEYEYIIRCLIGMYTHQDPGLIERAQNYHMFLKLIKVRRRQLRKNSWAQKRINMCEETKLKIENNVDLEVFPNIEYITEMRVGNGVVVPKEPVLGCECEEGCNPRSLCCGRMAASIFAYGKTGKLRSSERFAIYECNSRCRCPATCTNRVVQRGRRVRLCIFKTKSCGWGVKTLERIPKGKFICQYLGELIPDSEAVVRDIKYHKEKRTGYLFDLDFFEDAQMDMYCIDATECGNVARFINHSCDPNLVVYPVWINCLEPNLHLLAFFAKRNIDRGEEIHFDYENLQEISDEKADDDLKNRGVRMMSDLRCQCKAANCRNWVFGNK